LDDDAPQAGSALLGALGYDDAVASLVAARSKWYVPLGMT
jgi:hypothetical protein